MIVVMLGLLQGSATAGADSHNISGTWAVSVNLEGGPQNVLLTLMFKQDGEKLTGTQSGGFGDANITGMVKGNKVTFSADAKNRSGQPMQINFVGKLESTDKMTGTLEFPKGPGIWTANRK